MKLLNIQKETNNEYLNLYRLELINKVGNHKDYYLASRRDKEELACVTRNHNICDGVLILPITKEDEVVLIKQYRPAIGDFIYELPAGLIDKGEEIEEAAKRELYEETGLRCLSSELILKPSYVSAGLTDESIAVVKMLVEGEPNTDNLEEDEEIEVIKIKFNELKDFISKNNVAAKEALILMILSK